MTTNNVNEANAKLNVNLIVNAIYQEFASCNIRPSNSNQYTVLAGFALLNTSTSKIKVPALATGVKCLPTSRYSIRGDNIHDSHAEVLARRCLLRWLYDQVRQMHCSQGGEEWVEFDRCTGRYKLKGDVKLYMYVSTVPCGDASMRFLASSQDPEMAALKDSSPPVPPPVGEACRGRDGFALHGVLRTKPGRADSPPTKCMSCSDKIASWNVLGLQGSLASEIFDPLYIDNFIIGDVPTELQNIVREDCKRAFWGRLEGLNIDTLDLELPFKLAKPELHFTDVDFIYSRASLQKLNPSTPVPASCNEASTWSDVMTSSSRLEVIVNGARRGVSPKQQGLDKFIPRTCKLQLFRQHSALCRILDRNPLPSGKTYYEAKAAANADFRAAKAALKGRGGPFAGWVVSGREWESFDEEGNVKSWNRPCCSSNSATDMEALFVAMDAGR